MQKNMEWIVIVGATGAFGAVMTKRFADRGFGVIAVARNADSLQKLADRHANLVPCIADISQDSAIDAIRAALPGPVRMVVHGPGVSVGGGVLAISTAALVDAVNIKAGGMLRLTPVGDTPPVPAGRALQFWTKPQGAAGPTSLGLVRPGQPVQMAVTRLPGVGAQQLFEITLEPENGSPIGRPAATSWGTRVWAMRAA